MHYQRTVHVMTLCSKTVKTVEVVLYLVIEHGMTPFRFQTAQKNSASLRYSVCQFDNSMTSYRALLLNKARLPIF